MTDSLPKERLDELDDLADAATPGPWEVHETNEFSTLRFMRPYPEWTSPTGGYLHLSMGAENAAFIAAADPDTVRALIAQARRAEEAISGAQWVDEQLRRSAGHVSNAEARVKAAESERDEAVHHAEIALGRAAAANEKLEQVRALAAANNRLRDSENACMVYAPSILAIIDQTKEGE